MTSSPKAKAKKHVMWSLAFLLGMAAVAVIRKLPPLSLLRALPRSMSESRRKGTPRIAAMTTLTAMAERSFDSLLFGLLSLCCLSWPASFTSILRFHVLAKIGLPRMSNISFKADGCAAA